MTEVSQEAPLIALLLPLLLLAGVFSSCVTRHCLLLLHVRKMAVSPGKKVELSMFLPIKWSFDPIGPTLPFQSHNLPINRLVFDLNWKESAFLPWPRSTSISLSSRAHRRLTTSDGFTTFVQMCSSTSSAVARVAKQLGFLHYLFKWEKQCIYQISLPIYLLVVRGASDKLFKSYGVR